MTANEDESLSLIDQGFLRFIRCYNAPRFDFDINLARLFVCLVLIWKLFSRDFGFFGRIPEHVFYFYPYKIYPLDKYICLTGLPVIQDLATFHWVHWFLPHPGVFTLRVIQAGAILLVISLAVFGRGPRKILLISTYSVLIYLWGYLFLLGQEVDAVDLYFGLLLALGISSHDDRPIWQLRALYAAPATVNGGRAFSNLILVFVFYYFASGINKLTDITPLGWFDFDLVEAIRQYTIVAEHSTLATLDIFHYFPNVKAFDYIGPPLAYVSHLLVPTIFFRRSAIPKFFLFYFAFHLLNFGVGISFTGYIFIWAVLFPWKNIITKLRGLRVSGNLIAGHAP